MERNIAAAARSSRELQEAGLMAAEVAVRMEALAVENTVAPNWDLGCLGKWTCYL